jgi:hypothetical protein
MVIAILATLAVAGAAFAVYMRESNQASANMAHYAQAELAARAGLEHAIAVIEYSRDNLQVASEKTWCPGDSSYHDTPGQLNAGWPWYFRDPVGIGTTILDFDPELAGDEKTGRLIPLEYGGTKHAEYVVCVEDIDGRLHANLAKWSARQAGDPIALVKYFADVDDASDPDVDEDMVGTASAATAPLYSSLAEMARRAGAHTIAGGKYELGRGLRCYPLWSPRIVPILRQDSSGESGGMTTINFTGGPLEEGAHAGMLAVFLYSHNKYAVDHNGTDWIRVVGDSTGEPVDPASGLKEFNIHPRPAINLNTVRQDGLVAMLQRIKSFEDAEDPGHSPQDKAEVLAGELIALRPFADRHEFEDAVRRYAGDDAVANLGPDTIADDPYENHLTERQFNDVLNSCAGPLTASESAYDEPSTPGTYSFDGWEPFSGEKPGPSQTGGDHTDPATGDLTNDTGEWSHNITWSTELKFESRFFHIYVLGRGWSGEPAGEARCHAIYDAAPAGGGAGRIIWLRWNLSARGSVSDYGE